MTAYYNEIDPYAAQWLRNLIAAGHIAPGDVDERSIEDVAPDDLKNYRQCHFFAGIGVWSHAARAAGWADDRELWTGSCPCQPFSAAGKGGGFADERHLWPAFFYLIGERRPSVIFGEQVAGKNGLGWLDLIQADLEGLDYACGALVAPAAGFGAPHIRERLYWVAHATSERRGQIGCDTTRDRKTHTRRAGDRFGDGSAHVFAGGMGDCESERRERRPDDGDEGRRQCASGQAGSLSRMVNTNGGNAGAQREQRSGEHRQLAQDGVIVGGRVEDLERPGPTNGFWRAADWLSCTDGLWRPVEPGTFPLADGITARVGKLRAYGNAIVAPQAQAFIEVAMQAIP